MNGTSQRFSVLGPVRAWIGTDPLDLGPVRQQALLVALMLRPDQTVGRQELLDGVWGAEPPGTGVKVIPVYVHRLRERLRSADPSACMISRERSGYRFVSGSAEVDAARLETIAAEARAERDAGDLSGAADTLTRALALFQGEPLTGLPGPFAEGERLRLAERRIALVQAKLECELRLGRYAEAVGELAALTAMHPHRESLAALLMRALYGNGRQTDALSVFNQVRTRLVTDLAVEPGEELRRVHQAVLRADDAYLLGTPAEREPAPIQVPAPRTPRPARNELPSDVGELIGRTRELARLTTPFRPSGSGDANGPSGTADANRPPGPGGADEPGPGGADGPPGPGGADGPPGPGGGDGLPGPGDMDALDGGVPDLLPDAVPVAAVNGVAGVGKTALVVHAARALRSQYPDGCLFVDLHGHSENRGPLSPARALHRLLRAVGADQDSDDPDELAASWRAATASVRLLLVLDDAFGTEQVRPLLPAGPGSTVLLTSRRRLVGLDVARRVHLEPLDPADAEEILARIVGRTRAARERDSVRRLAHLCGRLPLALRIAAARLQNRPMWTFADLVARLTADGHPLRELTAENRSVETAFRLSYTQLPAPAQRAFRALGLSSTTEFDRLTLATMLNCSQRDAEHAMESLVDASLLHQPTAGHYRLHDLVAQYAHHLATEHHNESHLKVAGA